MDRFLGPQISENHIVNLEALAAYADSDSSEDESEDEHRREPPAKRPRASADVPAAAELPPPELRACSTPPAQALPPPELDDAPSLPPPELDDVLTTSDAAVPQRVRQFAHVDGQFATHVYLSVAPGPALQRAIDGHAAGLVASSRGRGEPATVHTVGAAEYHVSLSRTCVLRQPQLAAFAEALRVALRGCRAARATTAGARELANDSRTRFFAAVELASGSAGHAAVCRMIDAVDGVCARFGQPPFYAERRLHFSVAWSLAPMPPAATAAPALGGHELSFDQVACKIGERVTVFKLKAG